MVVIVNDMFYGLNEQMRDSVAKPEIDDILKGLKSTIIESYMLIKNSDEGSITVTLEKLPLRLSETYLYEVQSFTLGNYYYLNLTVDKLTSTYTVTESIGLANDEVDMLIYLKSIESAHYLTTSKTSTGTTIRLDDR
jgi:hypothetical protein